MREWFVYQADGQHIGPVSGELLARGIRAGKVPRDAYVGGAGDPEWKPILAVEDIATALRSLESSGAPMPPASAKPMSSVPPSAPPIPHEPVTVPDLSQLGRESAPPASQKPTTRNPSDARLQVTAPIPIAATNSPVAPSAPKVPVAPVASPPSGGALPAAAPAAPPPAPTPQPTTLPSRPPPNNGATSLPSTTMPLAPQAAPPAPAPAVERVGGAPTPPPAPAPVIAPAPAPAIAPAPAPAAKEEKKEEKKAPPPNPKLVFIPISIFFVCVLIAAAIVAYAKFVKKTDAAEEEIPGLVKGQTGK